MASPSTQLSFLADQQSPFLAYALRFIVTAIGVPLQPDVSAPGGPVDVYYGNDGARPCGLRIPRVDGYSVETVPRPPDQASLDGVEHEGRGFPFDLFAAVRFWLADEAHADAAVDAFDEHGRLRAERSAQEALGVREVPIVNAYLLHFREWVRRRFGAAGSSAVPEGKRCIIVLSHDVDSPIDPGSARHAVDLALSNVRHGTKVAQSAAYAAGAIYHAVRSRARDPAARHELFERVMDEEEKRGFRSTFFFAAVSRFDVAGCRRDVGYDVRRPPLPDVVRAVASRGFGVGLHIAYETLADAERMAYERRRLEEVAGVPVTGSRHHYWRMTRPLWGSLAAHGRAGLRFDSSVGFNRAPGYRLGVALPFRPWDPQTGSPVSAVQVPTLLMDSMLFPTSGTSLEQALQRVEGLVAALKRYEGVAAIDWHEYTSFPASSRYRSWGEGYLALLDLLAADDEVAVQTYDELVDRVTSREGAPA